MRVTWLSLFSLATLLAGLASAAPVRPRFAPVRSTVSESETDPRAVLSWWFRHRWKVSRRAKRSMR
ncbi:hypothetical protein DAEQUDRAFT_731264 [Daedalea quercina L-15889]|uniref:Uncharacterized protein n=1 Tax=Daedalea quercina L-15889 TaxID=1314783 RepID=A0A165MEF0_9APHY|nr:hypothetical protein DAEQUDRAFT_731264 [Daedalea quercina L-15889]